MNQYLQQLLLQMCHRHNKISLIFLLFFYIASIYGYGERLQGGSLIISSSSIPKSFNPIVAKETSTTFITGFIFEGLTSTDGVTQEIKPNLAESWNVDSTGRVWTFNLRKDVFWNDGVQFTASDVKFTFDRLISIMIYQQAAGMFLLLGKEISGLTSLTDLLSGSYCLIALLHFCA